MSGTSRQALVSHDFECCEHDIPQRNPTPKPRPPPTSPYPPEPQREANTYEKVNWRNGHPKRQCIEQLHASWMRKHQTKLVMNLIKEKNNCDTLNAIGPRVFERLPRPERCSSEAHSIERATQRQKPSACAFLCSLSSAEAFSRHDAQS